MTLLLLHLLLAAPTSEAAPTPDPHAMIRADVRGTAASIAQVEAELGALSPDERAQVAASLRTLSVSCPYTRSALLLPFALSEAVMAIPAERLDRLVQHDWLTLQEGLATHVAVLSALGVSLPSPLPGDPLHQPGAAMLDRDALLAAGDPLGEAAQRVAAIPVLAGQLDEAARAEIDWHSDRVEALTGVVRPCPRGPWALQPGQAWTLGLHLAGWHDALRRVEPFAKDAETRNQIGAMMALLDAYGEAHFLSR